MGALGGASVRPELRLVPPEGTATASVLRFRKQSRVGLHCQQDSALSQRDTAPHPATILPKGGLLKCSTVTFVNL